MYEKSDERKLYWLIDKDLSNEINERTFCVEFYYCYDLEINKIALTEVENQMFYELDQVVSRFSPYEEDHILDEHAFTSVKELRNKIQETKNILSE